MFMFLFSLIPATLLAVAGFLVMFASSKAEGGVQTFGRILSNPVELPQQHELGQATGWPTLFSKGR